MNLSQAKKLLDNPNFVKWFGKSAVKDSTGQPLRVYHGTNAPDFESFANDKIGSATGEPYFGKGHYFSDDPEYVGIYAGEQGYGKFSEGGRIIPAFLKMEKPYHIPWKEEGRRFPDTVKFTEKIKKEGYDGVIIEKNPKWGFNEYVVFEPEQIKSPFSKDFNPTNPNILKGATAIAAGSTLLSKDALAAKHKKMESDQALQDAYSPVDMVIAGATGGATMGLRAISALADPVVNYALDRLLGD
jgi:hypothetical protein